MTISQKLPKYKYKPLKAALATILFSSFTLIFSNTVAFAAENNSLPMTLAGSPQPIASPSTTPPSTTEGMISPSTDSDSSVTQTTAPIQSTATTVVTQPPAVTTTISGDKTPLNQPNMSDTAVLNWATEATKSAYSYDFKNYAKQIQENKQYFTAPGWAAFMAALDKSNNLKVVENKKLVASAATAGKPVILKKGVRNGIYTWKIQIPLLATYESESKLIKQNLTVNLMVLRNNSVAGVGISHFVAVVVPGTQPLSTTTTQTSTTGTSGAAVLPVPTTTNVNTITVPSATTPSTTLPSTTPAVGTSTRSTITTPTTTVTPPPTTGVSPRVVPSTSTITSPTTPSTVGTPSTTTTTPSSTMSTTPGTGTSTTTGTGTGPTSTPTSGTGTTSP